MNKKVIFIFALIIVFCIFFYFGFTFQRNNKQNDIIKNDMIFDEENKTSENETLEIASQEIKATPNTKLVLKKYYIDCGHTIENTATIPDEMVNLTKEKVQEKYPEWNVEEFSYEKIVLAKTIESFCGEHYYVTEENNYISIYVMDEEENKTLKETGKISCEYLPETDRIALKNGILIYGTEELNKLLEDFE